MLQSRIRGRREVNPLCFRLKGTLIKFDLRTLLLQFTLLIRFENMFGIVLCSIVVLGRERSSVILGIVVKSSNSAEQSVGNSANLSSDLGKTVNKSNVDLDGVSEKEGVVDFEKENGDRCNCACFQ